MKKIISNLEIQYATGGNDAKECAGILFKIYIKWLKKHKINFSTQKNEQFYQIFFFNNCPNFLQKEKGIHKFLRFSPFKNITNKQTSFIKVNFSNRSIIKNIEEKNIKYIVFKASGKGGQHRNKKMSAVKAVHIPTKITAVSKDSRSQLENRRNALILLKKKVIKYQQNIILANKIKNNIKKDWSQQIKTYCLYGKKYIKNHITKKIIYNTEDFLQGKIEF